MINIEETGDSCNSAILFLHGFMGSSQSLMNIASELSDNFHCLLPDLPGHGKSLFRDNSELMGMTDFMDIPRLIINQLLDRGIKEYSIYGYSMGGRIAQGITLMEPERVKYLFLESSSFGIKDINMRQERMMKDNEMLNGITTEADFSDFLHRWHSLPLFSTLTGTALGKTLIEEKMINSVDELKKALEIMGTGNQPYFLDKLGESKVDISFLYGEKDSKYRETAEDAGMRYPGIRLFPVPDTSHNAHLQFPDRVVSIIRKVFEDSKGDI